jgi:hypothetical protein
MNEPNKLKSLSLQAFLAQLNVTLQLIAPFLSYEDKEVLYSLFSAHLTNEPNKLKSLSLASFSCLA